MDADEHYDLYWIDVVLNDLNGCTDGAYRGLPITTILILDEWALCAGPTNVTESGDSGIPAVSDERDALIRLADSVGMETTLGQLPQLPGFEH